MNIALLGPGPCVGLPGDPSWVRVVVSLLLDSVWNNLFYRTWVGIGGGTHSPESVALRKEMGFLKPLRHSGI